MKATDDPATIGKVDMVIFSVKLRDTESAARAILPVIGPDTGVISLQNGVQKDDMLAPIVGRKHLLGGAAYIGVSIARPGVIRKAGTHGAARLRRIRQQGFARARRRSSMPARRASIKADIPADITLELWQKFVFLVAMSSVDRVDALDHRADPLQSADAAVRARHHEGGRRGRPRPWRARSPRTSPSAHRSTSTRWRPRCSASMALDLQLGRPLELPWLAGAVVDLGAQKGVPTPCCRAVRDILALYVDGKPG